MTTTTAASVDTTALSGLRARFRGALLRPGEEGYEEARRVWNGAIDRHPALIARCAGADDVVEAVRFARQRDLAGSVRGGGHSVAGHGVSRRRADDRPVADEGGPGRPRGPHRPGRRRRPVAGARRGHPAGRAGHHRRDHRPHRHRRAHPGRRAGPPDAQARADRRQPAGRRPGHRRRPAAAGRRRARAGAAVGAARRRRQLRDRHRLGVPAAPGGPDGAGRAGRLGARRRRPGAGLPGRLRAHGPRRARHHHRHDAGPAGAVPAARAPWQAGGDAGAGLGRRPGGGAAGRRPLLGIGRPLAELVRPVPYVALQSMLDGGAPHGRHYHWRSHRIHGLPGQVAEVLLDRLASITSPFSQIGGWAMGGAVSRADPAAAA